MEGIKEEGEKGGREGRRNVYRWSARLRNYDIEINQNVAVRSAIGRNTASGGILMSIRLDNTH